MLEYRQELLAKLLQASDETKIESIIKGASNELIEQGTNKHLIVRFWGRLESDINFVLQQGHNEAMQKMLKRALSILNSKREKLKEQA